MSDVTKKDPTKAVFEMTLKLSLTDLKAQKAKLLELEDCKEVQGLINLIDSIQDHAVDVEGFDEKDVFNLNEDF